MSENNAALPGRKASHPPGAAELDEAGLHHLRTKAKSGVLWLLIQNLGSKGMGLVFFVILARLLDPESFGLMAAAAVFLAVSDLLMEQGLGQAIVQRADLRPEHLDMAFWVQFGVALVVCAAGIILAPWLAELYGHPELTPVIRLILLNTPLVSLAAIQEALLERKLEFKTLARRRLAAGMAGGITAVGMALAGQGVWSLVGQQLVGSTAAAIMLWTTSGWRPGRHFELKALRELMGFSVNVFLQRGAIILKTRADHFLIGFYLGPVALGIYTTAYRVVEVSISLFVDTFSKFTLPFFSRLQSSADALRKAYETAIFTSTTFSVPAAVGIALLAPEIVRVSLGEKWLGVIPLLRVLACLVFTRSLATANSAVILAKGHSFFRLIVMAGYALTSFLLVLLVVEDGSVNVALINVACAFALLPINAWMIRKLIGFGYGRYFALLWPAFVAALAMAAAIISFRVFAGPHLSALTLLGAAVIGGGLVYGAVLWVISPLFRHMAHDVVGWLRTKIRAKFGPARLA